MSKYKLPTTKDLLNAGVHYGHQVKRWNPEMEKYIYSVVKNIHVIDLVQTEELLKEACEFLYETAKTGKKIIFVGTKKQARDTVANEAKRSGALYITERWLGGTITNFDVIYKNNIKKLIDLKRQKEAGELSRYTKKERLLIDREIERLERYVGGIESLNDVPGALFVIDTKREKTAIKEANIAKVPVVGLVDTNSSPQGIDYLIPGNDDAIKSIVLIVQTLSNAVAAGYEEFGKGLTSKSKTEDKPKEEKETKDTEKKEESKPKKETKVKKVKPSTAGKKEKK